MIIHGDSLDRLMDKFTMQPSGCWIWQGSQNGVGYGELRFGKVKKYAHRLMYELFNGPIPGGQQIDHLCRNRSCVNPMHLEAVSASVNVRRAMPYRIDTHKTHCSNGHEYTIENSYQRKDGKGRNCNECVRTRAREYQKRKRVAV